MSLVREVSVLSRILSDSTCETLEILKDHSNIEYNCTDCLYNACPWDLILYRAFPMMEISSPYPMVVKNEISNYMRMIYTYQICNDCQPLDALKGNQIVAKSFDI